MLVLLDHSSNWGTNDGSESMVKHQASNVATNVMLLKSSPTRGVFQIGAVIAMGRAQECDIFFNLLGSKTLLPTAMSKFADRRFNAVKGMPIHSFCQRKLQGKIDVCRRQCSCRMGSNGQMFSIQPFDKTIAMPRSFQMSCRTTATKGQCDMGKPTTGLGLL